MKFSNDGNIDVQNIQFKIIKIVNCLKPYKWIVDSYVSDFYRLDHPARLPDSWWETLSFCSPPELASLLSLQTWNNTTNPWPLSLLAFRTVIHTSALHRYPESVTEQETDKSQPVRALEHCYRRHVKPKKQHEILNMAKKLHSICSTCDIERVVDVGAGHGHLSRLLAYGYGHQVTTIEAADTHAPKATKFDGEVKRDIEQGRLGTRKRRAGKKSKSNQSEEPSPALVPSVLHQPLHVIARIDPNCSTEDFLNKLNSSSDYNSNNAASNNQAPYMYVSNCDKTLPENSTAENSNDDNNLFSTSSNKMPNTHCEDKLALKTTVLDTSPFLMTGLHACGDLSATMLRVFCRCQHVTALASVACCYMKLNSKETSGSGYPMSAFLRSLPDHELGYEAREMACHFIDTYHQRLISNPPELVSHCYRAALQEVIYEKAPHIQHGQIKLSVKRVDQLTFEQYAHSALSRLGIDPTLSPEQLSRAERRLAQWQHVVAFYTLRLSLAPLVETLILLDRIMYLAENGVGSELVPIFNPDISPRNFLLIAKKQTNTQ